MSDIHHKCCFANHGHHLCAIRKVTELEEELKKERRRKEWCLRKRPDVYHNDCSINWEWDYEIPQKSIKFIDGDIDAAIDEAMSNE